MGFGLGGGLALDVPAFEVFSGERLFLPTETTELDGVPRCVGVRMESLARDTARDTGFLDFGLGVGLILLGGFFSDDSHVSVSNACFAGSSPCAAADSNSALALVLSWVTPIPSYSIHPRLHLAMLLPKSAACDHHQTASV